MQLTHDTTHFNKQTFPVTVICDNVSYAPNLGSLFRICDAFGVEELIFCGEDLPIPSRKMQKTARATDKYVNYRIVKNIHEAVTNFKETHQIVALEITDSSKAIQEFKFEINQPIALLVGDENFGISENIINQSDAVIHINMYGKNSSMNVVQATNIALYEITKQLSIKK